MRQAPPPSPPTEAPRPAPRPAPAPRRPGDGPPRRGWLWRYRRLLFLVALLASTALAGVAYLLTRVPLPADHPPAQTTFLYDTSGAQLAMLHGGENRVPVPLERVPDVVQSAVVAAEDHNFFQHGGVDPLGIVRATYADLRGRALQGGSTITQQYVKNAYVGRDRTVVRKLKEAVIALKLEQRYDKKDILERYLNTIYLGRGAYGVEAAAEAYFGKHIGDVTLPEAAYLAGLIRSPVAADVRTNPTLAVRQRARVLAAMTHTHAITSDDRAQAERTPLDAPGGTSTERQATVSPAAQGAKGTEYFVEYVRRELLRAGYTEDQLLHEGLHVHTTLDLKLQSAAYDAVYGLLNRPDDPAGALVALDNAGRVVAMVGGRDWSQSKVNLAVGPAGGGSGRQGGSAFKPFVLAETIHEGYSVESSFPGPAQLVIPGADEGRDWVVNNFENEAFDRVNLIEATAQSVNTVYAQLVTKIGPQRVAAMANQLGITSSLKPVPSITLGTQEVSVLDMASAYSTFANDGVHIEPQVITKVTTADGRVLMERQGARKRVLEPSETEMVDYVLHQVIDHGTGTSAAFGKPAAGKTGTSEDYGDAWFAGYTPSLTAAVWMGYTQGQSIPMLDVHGRKVNGGSFPAMVFSRFMTKATQGRDADDFTAPTTFPGKILGSRIPAQSGPAIPYARGSSDAGPPTTTALRGATGGFVPTTAVRRSTPTTAYAPPATEAVANPPPDNSG